ncbi:hypothetical protein K432DRAFT_310426, partial [Lepidopterella palustris CBS 459.81]
LQQEARNLEQQFSTWTAILAEDWKPKTIGKVNEDQLRSSRSTGWPGYIENYFDLYAAAVWNTYRKTHLMILDIIVRCSKCLRQKNICLQPQAKAQQLADDIAASIPYHLADNVLN